LKYLPILSLLILFMGHSLLANAGGGKVSVKDSVNDIVEVTDSARIASAHREPISDYRQYFRVQQERSRLKKERARALGLGGYDTVNDRAQSIVNFDWHQVIPSRISERKMLELFTYIRDRREFVDQTDFKRRITWLYPDDGCYVRSALMQALVAERTGETWNQIFLFGNLEFKTEFSPTGSVTWWYHVAPIVRTAKGIYVLDPAVDFGKPLLLKSWLSFVNGNSNSMVAICNASAYSPDSYCTEEPTSHGDEALREEQDVFFDYEWNRLQSLGLKPEEFLGEQPPWQKSESFL
jgi:hypothetical protein